MLAGVVRAKHGAHDASDTTGQPCRGQRNGRIALGAAAPLEPIESARLIASAEVAVSHLDSSPSAVRHIGFLVPPSQAMIYHLQSLVESVQYHWRYYCDYLLFKWNHISPMEYGILLISVGVFGYLLMRSASKRT